MVEVVGAAAIIITSGGCTLIRRRGTRRTRIRTTRGDGGDF